MSSVNGSLTYFCSSKIYIELAELVTELVSSSHNNYVFIFKQLAALVSCRNHALIDVETALEAAEGQMNENMGKRLLVPVSMMNKRGTKQVMQPVVKKVKEVPLKLFHQGESVGSDLPYLDPLRLRTE